jgi:phosphoribosylaminoimidazole carboxylase PurE protein
MDKNILVSIIVGSDSDLEIAGMASNILKQLDIKHSINIASAHRSLPYLQERIKKAEQDGAKVFIAIAGMSAALPGIIAAHTILPVIGVPVQGSFMSGLDSLFSMVQMPQGIPVATMSMGKSGSANAALFSAQIIALYDEKIKEKLVAYKKSLSDKVVEKDEKLQKDLSQKSI